MGGVVLPQPYWFFLNNPETLNTVTLTFCSIKQNFIKDVCAKFGIPILTQYQDIGQNSDKGISNFRIYGQSLIKENCHNSITSNDTDMKHGLVTKLDKRNKTTSKKLTMMPCQQIIVIFPIYNQFGVIWSRIPDA